MVKLLSPKSAEPPQNSGSTLAIAFIVSPEALRVATDAPGSNFGMTPCQSFGNSRALMRLNSEAPSGLVCSHLANILFQL